MPFDWEELEDIYGVVLYSKVRISPEGQYVASLLVSDS
jgi:hypothetical protein